VSVFVPAPRVCRFTLGFSQAADDEPFHVVLELGKVDEWPDGGGAMDDYASAITLWWNNDGSDVFSEDVSASSLTAQRMLAYSEPIYDLTDSGWPVAGGVSGGCFPTNVSVIAKKKTGMTGRSRNGRTYWSGVPLSSQHASSFNRLSSAAHANFITAMDLLLTNLGSVDEGAQLAVVSRFTTVGTTHNVPRDEATFLFVTDYDVENAEFATRRKRLPRPR